MTLNPHRSPVIDATPPLVSVVIPAFNEAERLPETLRRIRLAFDAHREVTYEIIVCDNNSADSTAALARSDGCTVVFEPINQISRARNRGARVASGSWLLFVDADSWPPVELIGDIEPLLTSAAHVGCGSTVRVIDGPRWFRFVLESKNWSMRAFKWCLGAFILCRRDAFMDVGGFSDEYYIFEEIEFLRRLKVLGAERGQRFVILNNHPFVTSGRKGAARGILHWLVLALRLTVLYRKSVRDRAFAKQWYEVDR